MDNRKSLLQPHKVHLSTNQQILGLAHQLYQWLYASYDHSSIPYTALVPHTPIHLCTKSKKNKKIENLSVHLSYAFEGHVEL